MISISIVSHGHGDMVAMLLQDLARIARDTPLEVIVTNNISKARLDHLPPGIDGRVIFNPRPLGIGRNHNNALKLARGNYVCVINPDVRLPTNPFPDLLRKIDKAGVGLVAPGIVSGSHHMEDSARYFPTPLSLFRRVIGWDDGRHHFSLDDESVEVEWVAGMFMLTKADIFHELSGFDPAFFLYCEDIDFCARIRQRRFSILLCPKSIAIHDARRDSHRKAQFLWWHIKSYLRYFSIYWLGFSFEKKNNG